MFVKYDRWAECIYVQKFVKKKKKQYVNKIIYF